MSDEWLTDEQYGGDETYRPKDEAEQFADAYEAPDYGRCNCPFCYCRAELDAHEAYGVCASCAVHGHQG